MQKVKKVIIILGIILIVIISIIAILTINKIRIGNLLKDKVTTTEYKQEKTLQLVDDKLDFYAIQDCVEKYYIYYARTFNAEDYYSMTYGRANNSETIKEYEQKSATVLYNMLDEELKQTEEITIENIKTKLKQIKISSVNIINMYVCEQSENINIYIAEGILKEENTDNIMQFQIIINLNIPNRTFSIIPQEYVEKNYKDIEIGKGIDINVPESIPENDNNTFRYKKTSEETYVQDLFAKLKDEIKYYPELAYNNLDEEYRNKKFESLEDFKKYINNNEEKYSKMQVKEYQKTIEDDYTQYICVDQDGNYYIFRETSLMQYNLMLDTYTIDLSDFIEKYDSSEENVKVALNIEKLRQAIKDGDYKYVYNKLDNTFKSNNFKTLEIFENYIKDNFSGANNVEYKQYEQITGVHVYNLGITNSSEGNTINAKVVMQLKDERDFAFSFSVEN